MIRLEFSIIHITKHRRLPLLMAAIVTALAVAGMLATAAPTQATTSPRPHITLDMGECGTMYLGTTGSCIISLQTWMNWAVADKSNVPTTAIDGVYGRDTLRIVQEFQRRYVPEIQPNGAFGPLSRAGLKRWFENGVTKPHSSTHLPCNVAYGWGCESGAAVAGLNPGGVGVVGKSAFCAGVGEVLPGKWGLFGAVVCDVVM